MLHQPGDVPVPGGRRRDVPEGRLRRSGVARVPGEAEQVGGELGAGDRLPGLEGGVLLALVDVAAHDLLLVHPGDGGESLVPAAWGHVREVAVSAGVVARPGHPVDHDRRLLAGDVPVHAEGVVRIALGQPGAGHPRDLGVEVAARGDVHEVLLARAQVLEGRRGGAAVGGIGPGRAVGAAGVAPQGLHHGVLEDGQVLIELRGLVQGVQGLGVGMGGQRHQRAGDQQARGEGGGDQAPARGAAAGGGTGHGVALRR